MYVAQMSMITYTKDKEKVMNLTSSNLDNASVTSPINSIFAAMANADLSIAVRIRSG